MIASTIWRYQPGSSPLHKADARVKLVSLIVLVMLSLAINTPVQLAFAALTFAVLAAASQLGPKAIATNVRPIVPFVTIVGVFNLFMAKGGATLLTLGPLELTTGGIWIAVLYAARLLMAVGLGAFLLLTTTPTQLTDAFESLLSPLSRLGVPTHEITMVLSLALRFVPVLANEAQSVMDAQATRGGSFEDAGLIGKVRATSAVLVPMFAGAIRHAENLSRALDARCYEGGQGRTHYHEQRLRPQDAAFMVGVVLWAVALLAMNCLGI